MNNNYNVIRIQQYLKGELSQGEMHQLEREALDDPLLNDAIEGYRIHDSLVDHGQLSLLQQRLATRIAGQKKERDRFYFSWQRLSVAATACVLMVLVLVLLWLRSHMGQPGVAQKEVQVELAIPGSDSNTHAMAVGGAGLDAHPTAGWESFNAYLSENQRNVSVAGEVVLAFGIDAQGKPTAVQAVGKADTLLFAEAMRLLEQGPTWEGTKAKIIVSFD